MSFTSVDNRVRFSSSHPARQPFLKPKQGLGDVFGSKGTPSNKGSSGNLTRVALREKVKIEKEIAEQKARDEKAQEDWFNDAFDKLNLDT